MTTIEQRNGLPVRRWMVGDVKVTQVTEAPVETGLLDGLIADATSDAVKQIPWLYPDYANAEGQLTWNLHSYVLEVGGTRILVDTGVGNQKTNLLLPAWSDWDTDFLSRLAAAGHHPERIDIVLCTHMHLDHIGWNTTLVGGVWKPTFPRAVHLVVGDEFDYHSGVCATSCHTPPREGNDDRKVRARREQTRRGFEQSVWPLLEAGMIEFVASGHEVADGIRYVPTLGHTPAHHSVAIASRGECALITGDFIHHPVQIARTEWSSAGDFDKPASARNRRTFLESCAGTKAIVFGTHFTGSSAGTVVRDGDSFRLVTLDGEVLAVSARG
ncbi:MBL fold metallo-hydrolase [Mycobacterium sp. NPDC003449]